MLAGIAVKGNGDLRNMIIHQIFQEYQEWMFSLLETKIILGSQIKSVSLPSLGKPE